MSTDYKKLNCRHEDMQLGVSSSTRMNATLALDLIVSQSAGGVYFKAPIPALWKNDPN